MTGASTVATKEVTISLPTDVLREIDNLAAEKGRTRSQVMTGAARRYLFSEQRWREVQAVIAEGARQGGLFTEDDIEEYLDSLPDDPA